MNELPIDLANQLANNDLLQTSWGKTVFALSTIEARDAWLQNEKERLTARGFKPKSIDLYHKIIPLLLEGKPIIDYVRMMEDYDVMLGPTGEVKNIFDAIEHENGNISGLYTNLKEVRFLLRQKIIEQLGNVLDSWELAEMLEETRPYQHYYPKY